MADILTPTTGATAARYYYYTVDIISNTVLAQIPFEDVTYDRLLKGSGGFEGKITTSSQTDNLDLYNTTLPGKTAIYVMRNDVCVWGGIIWGRTYDLTGRSLSVSAQEFTSYLSRRHIWKTFDYKFTADLLKTSKTGSVKVTLVGRSLEVPIPVKDANDVATKVTVSFKDADLIKYSGTYNVIQLFDAQAPTETEFYINIPKLPASSTPRQEVTVNLKVDTYDLIREMVTSTFGDYYNVSFANEILAPGTKNNIVIEYRSSDSNIVTVTTRDVHDMVVGQNVKIANLNVPAMNGTYTVTGTPTTTSFTYKIPTYTITKTKSLDSTVTVTVATTGSQRMGYPVGSVVELVYPVGSPLVGLNGQKTIVAKTYNSFTFIEVFTEGTYTNTGSVVLPDTAVNATALDNKNYRVQFREIKSTTSKAITHAKRVAGYSTIWTKTPHGFKKNDAVTISVKDTSTSGSEKVKLSTLSTTATVLSVTSTSFTYYQADQTDAKANIIGTDSLKRHLLTTASKSTAVLATPIKRLVLSTEDTHDYEIGDVVYVTGVDGLDWTRPIYNGYQTVVETDKVSQKITHLARSASQRWTVYTEGNHGFDVGDRVTITGLTGDYVSFNGTNLITAVNDKPENASAGQASFTYRTYVIPPATAPSTLVKTDITESDPNAKAMVSGDDWMAFDMPEYGTIREPDDVIPLSQMSYKLATRTVTMVTKKAHKLSKGDKISISGATEANEVFNGTYRVVSVDAKEADKFTYQLPEDKSKIPTKDLPIATFGGSLTKLQTRVGSFPRVEVPVTRVQRVANVATVFSNDHDLNGGRSLTFNYPAGFESFENDGAQEVISNVTANTFTYSSPGDDYGVLSVLSTARTAKVLTVRTRTDHGFAAGQTVFLSGLEKADFNGSFTIATVNTGGNSYFTVTTSGTGTVATKTYTVGTPAKAVSTKAVSATAYIEYEKYGHVEEITTLSSSGRYITIGVENHNYNVGDYILPHVYGSAYKTYNNLNVPAIITSITDNTVTYLVSNTPTSLVSRNVNGQVALAAQVEKRPLAISRSYGEFPENSDLGGIEFSDENYSDLVYQNTLIRGSDLINVAEFLDRYSNSLNGFDYRIDCSMIYDEFNNKKFKRTFVLVPRIPKSLKDYLAGLPDGKLPRGEYAPPSAFEADKVVFEYPGNIGNFGIIENSSSAATRVFVVGNNDDLGSGASGRYSAASNTELLNDGWPLLDRVEKQEWPVYGVNVINVDNYGNYDAEMDFAKTANRFLDESKPPMGDINISVNGSLNPVIGTYSPGEWCSILINDSFFQSRLASNLEPRKDVVIRKIDRISVSVPNNPAFPEQITLELVPEWEVDKRGQ
jgi:hypothetical protein